MTITLVYVILTMPLKSKKGNEIMETIYRAFDGTIFEDKIACAEYEEKNKINPCEALKTSVLMDVDGDIISPTSFFDNPTRLFYVVIKNEIELNIINTHLSKNRLPTLNKYDAMAYEGCFYWDTRTERWETYHKLREDWKDASTVLEKFYIQGD